MVTIEYSAGGACVSDFEADSFAVETGRIAMSGVAMTTTISSEVAILSVRAAIARGEIPHNMVIVRYNGEDIAINRNGRMDKYPPGFCEKYDEYLEDIIAAEMGK